jgi:S-formylglutathione hydrolase FrmB
MAAGMDIRPFPGSWNMKDSLGEYESNRELWDKSTVIELVKGLTTTQNIVFECGVDDFFIQVNRNLHKAMVDAKIKHDYTERPGGHTWEYWCNALDYHMLFFSKAFDAYLQKGAQE